MDLLAFISARRAYTLGIFLFLYVSAACTPNSRSKFAPFVYKGGKHVALPQDSRGGITVRVKLYAGEAIQVKADSYSFTTGNHTRRGKGTLTVTEEGTLQPSSYFVLRSKRYSGILETRRVKGQWLYINHVPMDEYLTSVVGHEMSPQWHPEALKAQAVVARTYLLLKMKERVSKEYDVDTTTNFQVYGGLKKNDTGARNAVAQTHNEVLYYKGQLAQTFFHSSCGGTLASAKEVWGSNVSYLHVQSSPYCSSAPVYKWQVRIPFSEISRRLSARGVRSVRVVERGPSKRVKTLKIVSSSGTRKVRGDKFRMALGALKVKSTFFGVAQKGNTVILTGRGFGHGVGMCQWGAKIAAEKKGIRYGRILDHYFPGTSLRSVDPQNV
jgi:stage II sporulation protein D